MCLHTHYLFGSFKLGVDGLLFLCVTGEEIDVERLGHFAQDAERSPHIVQVHRFSVRALCLPLVEVQGEALPSGSAPHPPVNTPSPCIAGEDLLSNPHAAQCHAFSVFQQ